VRAAYGVDGSGVTVGIISDSYDAKGGAAADIAAGLLPGPGNPCGHVHAVRVLPVPAGGFSTSLDVGSDEGRAMAQVVHSVAPGARIVFASGAYGVYAFAQSIRDLAAAGATVIVDDLVYDDEPAFQPGPIDAAITDVTAHGAVYVTAANNTTVRTAGGTDLSSWETPAFRSAACPVGLPVAATHCEDLTGTGDGYAPIQLAAGSDLSLQWAEPYRGVTDRFVMYLLDNGGNVVATSTNGAQLGADASRWPITTLSTTSAFGGSIAIARVAGSGKPRLKLNFVQNVARSGSGWLDTPAPGDMVGPSVLGHNGNRYALSVAAVPQDSPTAPEVFSAEGPLTHYFGTWSATRQASALTAPLVLRKPDLAGVDGVRNTALDNGSDPLVARFYGTSAAAPGVAGVAALVRERFTGLTSAQVRALLRARTTAVSGGVDVVGTGLVDASTAFAALPGAPRLVGSAAGRRSVVLHFSAPNVHGVGLSGYSARCTSANGGVARTGARRGSPVTVTRLSVGKTYRCSVRANATYGPGPWSKLSGYRIPTAS